MKTFASLSELPNRRGEYHVKAQFTNDVEVVNVIIDYDVNEETGEVIKDRYSYIVESLNGMSVYDACWGFATIRDMVPNIEPRLKTIS